MAAEYLNMKIVDEIHRLKKMGFGKRKISRTLGIHRNTVSKYFDQPETSLSDSSRIASVVGAEPTANDLEWYNTIDWQRVRDEIQKDVPISIVYGELFEDGKVPVTYPAFWKQLRRRAPNLKTTMVRVFAPGSRIEIDYCDGIRRAPRL
jgi:lambda repressor-like predicted transcriptional regulator